MRKVAVLVRDGSFNNLVLLCTLIAGLLGAGEVKVRVLFRDEALLKLTKERVAEINFSPALPAWKTRPWSDSKPPVSSICAPSCATARSWAATSIATVAARRST